METRHKILTSKWWQVEVNTDSFSQQKVLHLNKMYVSSYWNLQSFIIYDDGVEMLYGIVVFLTIEFSRFEFLLPPANEV